MSKPRRPTPRQAEVHAFMREYRKANAVPPTIREIANHFGWASENSVVDHLKGLLKCKLVKQYPRRSRAWVPIGDLSRRAP